ncbi:MAG: hypothetical protein IT249_01210 [Chitinophagaceae bacterium]|nr:hypothetical protein [Chitinophagaceae bacterium]
MFSVSGNTPYRNHPVTHQLLLSLLKTYKRPNDKIHEMLKNGELTALKKGMYIWSNAARVEPFSIANALYGPSYISAESALAYRALIPEQVFAFVSMTTKPSKKFTNKIGSFEYTHLSTPYYAFGIKYEKLGDDQYAQVATGEKALFDLIITTSGILFRSTEAARAYLLENLRMEEEQLKTFDTATMQTWITNAPKKETLSFIIKAITSL